MSRRILVTGGAGFLGSHLVRRLHHLGDRVAALDDLSAPSPLGLPAGTLRVGDVCRVDDLARASRPDGAPPQLIVHLASVVGVDAVTADPERTGRVIREGTARVLALALELGVPLVSVSSSEVTDGPRRGPRAVYAAAKADAEGLVLDQAGRLPVTVIRPFNIVGPGQTSAGMVLPTLAAAARRGGALPVHGDGTQQRSFLHVADLVSVLVQLLQGPALRGAGLLEVGSAERIPIGELARRLAALAGTGARVRTGVVAPGREDRPRRAPDLAPLQALMPFRPAWSLDAILAEALQGETLHATSLAV